MGALGVDSDPAPCTAHDGKNFFDLNPLRSKTDYEVTTDVADQNITLNVCGSVFSEIWGIDEPDRVAGFYRGPHSDISIGEVNTTLRIAYGHPVITITNGSPCGGGAAPGGSGMKSSSIIQFTCDQNVFSKGNPHLLAQLPPGDEIPCTFFFEWRTHVACPTAMPGGNGGPLLVFAVIIFIAFLAYVVAATFYNRLVLGLRGWEQLPKFTGWGLCNIRPGRWFGSRAQNSSEPSWGSWRRDRSGYGQVSDEEVQGIVDGRFSLDEEDEAARDNRPLDSGIPPSGIHGGVIRL